MAILKQGDAISGKLGGRVYRTVPGGTIVASAPTGGDPRTPAQLEARRRFERASCLWSSLTLDEIERWRAYAARVGKRADNAFRGLAAKYLQVHGGFDAPSEPPASAFLGDAVEVVATGGAGCLRFAPSGANLPTSKTQSASSTPSVIPQATESSSSTGR